MKFECISKFIPFVNKITPNDVYKIYKKGSSIRIDYSLVVIIYNTIYIFK